MILEQVSPASAFDSSEMFRVSTLKSRVCSNSIVFLNPTCTTTVLLIRRVLADHVRATEVQRCVIAPILIVVTLCHMIVVLPATRLSVRIAGCL